MTWQAKLRLDYSLERQRTVARYTHEGPLRILQSLYPEGDAVCHNVLIHPPGGLVGGDTLALDIRVGAGAHGLITTPGATRFYRSLGPSAVQHTQIRLSNQSRLEWLPLENLCHTDCQAENRLMLDLAPGSECLGWDITALGLPHAQQAFDRGSFLQHLEAPGVWLERGKICATDQHLMQGSAGLAGNTCLGTLFRHRQPDGSPSPERCTGACPRPAADTCIAGQGRRHQPQPASTGGAGAGTLGRTGWRTVTPALGRLAPIALATGRHNAQNLGDLRAG